MRRIKTALVGLGFSGRTFHLPFLKTLPQFEISAVLSRQKALAQALVPGATCCEDMDKLLQQDVELAVITAPNSEHFPLAKAALEAGWHVVVEKPFVPESGQGEILCELAARQRRVLSVYHNRRWDGDFLTARALIEAGELGCLYHFESHFDRFRPQVRARWRELPGAGTGILYDLGSHLIDQALQLFGTPSAVTGQVLNQRPGAQAADYFHLVLDYAPLQVILHSSAVTVEPGPRFQIHGDGGSYIKRGLDPQEDALRAGVRPDAEGWGLELAERYGVLTLPAVQKRIATLAGDYSVYYQKLAAAIWEQSENPVKPEEALSVIKLIELAIQSSEEGRSIFVKSAAG